MESSVSGGLPTSSETDEEEGGVHATPACSAPSAPSPSSSHLSFSVENILAPGRFGHHSLHHNHRLAQTFIDDGKTPFMNLQFLIVSSKAMPYKVSVLVVAAVVTQIIFVNNVYRTVFENHRKSIIQHCERSELRLHFEWTKVN